MTKLSLSVSVRRRTIRLLPGPERFPRRNPCPLHPAAPDFDALVELKTVCHALSRSRASIYRDIERGGFAFRSALAIISSQSIVSFMPLLPDQVDFADAPVIGGAPSIAPARPKPRGSALFGNPRLTNSLQLVR